MSRCRLGPVLALVTSLLVVSCSSDPGGGDGPTDTGQAVEDTSRPDSGTDMSDTGADTGSPEDISTMPDSAPDTTGGDSGGPADTGSPDTGAGGDTAEADAADTGSSMQDTGPSLYQGTEPVYGVGALEIEKFEISPDNTQSPVAAIGYAPKTSGRYAVVAFQHGFTLKNHYYETILKHLAGHGFVVVAPQMYDSGVFGAPSGKEEAKSARKFYDWLERNLAGQISVTPAFDHFGIAGHSRGGKVTWMVLENGYGGASAVANLDPVDGSGGPGGGGSYVTEGGLSASLPSFILGTGLGPETKFGMACAPKGRNHVQFYEEAKSPSYHVVATKYGHMDMLDSDDLSSCGPTCSACVSGPSDDKLRETSAGMLTAFFRGTLQGTSGDLATLTDESAAPATVTTAKK